MNDNDAKKAKDAFSIHQDNLVWSRSQTLIAIQGGTLAGAYGLRATPELSLPLLGLGLALTVLLWIVVERDQNHRDAAFRQSGLEETPGTGKGVGRWLIRIALGLLLASDIYVFCWLVWKPQISD